MARAAAPYVNCSLRMRCPARAWRNGSFTEVMRESATPEDFKVFAASELLVDVKAFAMQVQVPKLVIQSKPACETRRLTRPRQHQDTGASSDSASARPMRACGLVPLWFLKTWSARSVTSKAARAACVGRRRG